jgi:2-dehydropantoate 2-reductase
MYLWTSPSATKEGKYVKILIIGTGVIGSIYGWQLSQIGHDIIHLVREGKKRAIDEQGLPIRCLDLRSAKDKWSEITYRPTIVEDFALCTGVELIIVSVKSNQLQSVLSTIPNNIENADILLFQNSWYSIDEIEKFLPSSKYFFGFPHIAGGGKDEEGIHCAIFGKKNARTMLGEKDGKITSRVLKVSKELEKARLNPKISKNINAWLLTHYAEVAGLLAGIMKAGSGEEFAASSSFIRESILAVREGFNVCKYRGINIGEVHPQRLYYLPLVFLVPLFKKIFSSEGAQLVINGHMSHSPDEMKAMFYDVLTTGQKYGMKMPHLSALKKYVDQFTIAKKS